MLKKETSWKQDFFLNAGSKAANKIRCTVSGGELEQSSLECHPKHLEEAEFRGFRV